MDICVLNPFFYPYKGGTEKVLLEVYRRLAKRHNITVITSAPLDNNRHSVEEVFGIRVVRLRTFQEHVPIFPMPFLFFDGLKRALERERGDIYHINNRYQFFEDSVKVIKGMDRKIALTIHNALPKNIDPLTDELGEFYDRIWGRKLMHAADIITGVSTSTINTTIPRSERHKTHLVFNGVDYRRFRRLGKRNESVARISKRMGFGADSTNILCNGRLVTQKGQKYLLHAFAELVTRDHEDLNMLIIGKGPLRRQLYSMAKKMGVERRFRITYGIDDDNLPYYYNACDIFSLPSLYEPAGLALLEALSCELPSVISRIGGMPEIAGNCGIYAKPGDHRSIKKMVKYVLENGDDASKLASKGRKRIIKYHDWDNISKQYEGLFLGCLRR
ncbi:MAG: glycosyltransferase family 4 protein [Candidatus Micrarchaeota archaeon]|nr:glycosyltransferase family 4 protein [Candidatus Micrarchaeota archaeon]